MKQLIAQQVQFILLMTISGMSLMAGYDVLRLFRWLFPHGQITIAVEDILYWCIVSVPIFYLFLEFHDGIIRWYGLVAVFGGILLYEYGLSRPIRNKVSAFFNRIRRKCRRRWEKIREQRRQQRQKEQEIKRRKREERDIQKQQKQQEQKRQKEKQRRQKEEQAEQKKQKRQKQEEEKRRQKQEQAEREKQKRQKQEEEKKRQKQEQAEWEKQKRQKQEEEKRRQKW